jgi:cysteinyl-tRNA synthetase
MSLEHLGEQLDIHGGGGDVIFPHHENEIAQSEAFTGKSPFVKYWIHNSLLRLREDEEKMTRHLGNVISIKEALEAHSADSIRLFILSSHYRSPLTWKEDNVSAAERGAERLRVALRDYDDSIEGGSTGALSRQADAARDEFIAAMDDDFNTPQAIAQIYDLARHINQARDEGSDEAGLAYAQRTLHDMVDVLGLTLEGRSGPSDVEPFVAILVNVRNQLREAKQWALADEIRDQLAAKGVVLEDSAEGTTWKYAPS